MKDEVLLALAAISPFLQLNFLFDVHLNTHINRSQKKHVLIPCHFSLPCYSSYFPPLVVTRTGSTSTGNLPKNEALARLLQQQHQLYGKYTGETVNEGGLLP
jgi:hypothetical protein